jgi:hypothetical protein
MNPHEKLKPIYIKQRERVKLCLLQAMEAHRIVRHWGFHIFYTINSQTAVRLSALRTGQLSFTPRKIPDTSVRGLDEPRAKVWVEGSGQLKNWMTSGITAMTT